VSGTEAVESANNAGTCWGLGQSKQATEPTGFDPAVACKRVSLASAFAEQPRVSSGQTSSYDPPSSLFKIPPAEWPVVFQWAAQGESLRQIAKSFHTSYEAVRRVLNAARKELMADEDASTAQHPEDEKE
jgi:hypothetical protein